ncbi:uncharacterized protein ATC70_007796 [Mucor velutinosus]|uniref:F-box domain-containing protein n=1 Tax=Mucor velutinosus TaxID=708070 RepID=A0AAN7D4F6_9FUNG|nr:hypothetical protein ATC70_007796 [Mucor velutinosus]
MSTLSLPHNINLQRNMLHLLPTEIVWKIMQTLDPVDLSRTRLVCKRLRTFSDHPALWRCIQLEASRKTQHMEDIPLWNLTDLKAILQLHLSHIQTIQIRGVRDNIVQYILLNCSNLQELTISGWSTLSDHAFRISTTPTFAALSLRRLRLIGQRRSNYTSIDATALGKLLTYCPHLEEITVVCCQIHVQAECFLQMMDQVMHQDQRLWMQQHQQDQGQLNSSSSLKSLVVATKRTWSSHHVMRLFQLCSNLRFLGLVPDSIEVVEYTELNQNNDEITAPMPILDHSSNATHANANNQPHLLTKDIQAIDGQEMLDSDNLIVYKLNNFNLLNE